MNFIYKLPPNIELIRSHDSLFIKGPKGELNVDSVFNNEPYLVDQKENTITTTKKLLLKKILDKKVNGVLNGFKIELNLIGIGYRAYIKDTQLNLRVGFSHDITIEIPNNIEIFLEDEKTIICYSIDYEFLSNFCSKIINYRPINKFTGQGIIKSGDMKKLQKTKKK